MVERVTPVAVLFALIPAPGMEAPVVSVIVPVIVAVAACPKSFGPLKHARTHRLNAETDEVLKTRLKFN
jgi:hypothetical protein